MITIGNIVEYLDSEVHPEYQEKYDNAGFLLGNPELECTGAIVAVDLTNEVIDEAIEKQCNLIVTHHPMIFGGVKRITPTTTLGQQIFRLIKSDIAVYAAHTNLDNLKNGVNGILAYQLGLTDCRILRQMDGQSSPEVGAGMIGSLPYPLPIEPFLDQVKMILRLPVIRISSIKNQVVSRVAICGGAGSFLIEDAVRAGADIYLTGDLKYHDFQQALDRITLADIGHFESEQFTKELIYSIISKKFSNFACLISDRGRSFVSYI